VSYFREKKRTIACIVMVVILSLLAVNNIALYKKYNGLKKEVINNMNTEWYQLYSLFDMIDRNYIKNNFQDPQRFQLYVNQTCYHFSSTGRPNELTVNMRNLLVSAYDPLFVNLSLEEGPFNMEKASELLKDMNDELLLLSKQIIDMQDNEKEQLLNPKTSKFIEVNTQVKNLTDKYIKAVDDYFKNYGK